MIHARGLTKTFKARNDAVDAVKGIDIDVEPGELVAFLGPNGAGKSTTLRMLTTLLEPTSGTAAVAGHDVRRDPAEVRRHIGYIGQGNGAGHYHQVRDEVVTQGCAYGMRRRQAAARADELLAALQLDGMGKRLASSLSGGQRRRLDIVLGLVHHPSLLFLDEPSTGLDPQNRANLWEHVMAIREQFGTTLFLTTHYLDEADQMAERVMVIDDGHVIADDTPTRLKSELASDRVTVRVDPEAGAAAANMARRGIANANTVSVTAGHIEVQARRGDEALPGYLRALDAADITVHAAQASTATLDDVFLALTGRSLRDDATAPTPADEVAA